MELTEIPVPCWICEREFIAPARLSILPPRLVDPCWYGKQCSANVWAYVDQTAIQAHVAEHWPMLVMLFYWWHGVVEVMGLDPLDYWRPR
jgi:hypothetical protein